MCFIRKSNFGPDQTRFPRQIFFSGLNWTGLFGRVRFLDQTGLDQTSSFLLISRPYLFSEADSWPDKVHDPLRVLGGMGVWSTFAIRHSSFVLRHSPFVIHHSVFHSLHYNIFSIRTFSYIFPTCSYSFLHFPYMFLHFSYMFLHFPTFVIVSELFSIFRIQRNK